MLSISEDEQEVTLVGCSMVGKKCLEVNPSRKEFVGKWLLCFNKSMLKSPRRIISLLVAVKSDVSWENSSLNVCRLSPGGLYIAPKIKGASLCCVIFIKRHSYEV